MAMANQLLQLEIDEHSSRFTVRCTPHPLQSQLRKVADLVYRVEVFWMSSDHNLDQNILKVRTRLIFLRQRQNFLLLHGFLYLKQKRIIIVIIKYKLESLEVRLEYKLESQCQKLGWTYLYAQAIYSRRILSKLEQL